MQSPDELEAQLNELRRLRREGVITPEEAYRRHEALMRPAVPVESPPTGLEPVASAPSRLSTPRVTTAVVATIIALVVAAIMGGVAVAMILDNGGSAPSSPAPRAAAPGAIASPTRVPNVGSAARPSTTPSPAPTTQPGPSTQPGTGCYDVHSPDDKLEIISADPPIGGPPPQGSIRVEVQYTLASHDTGRIVLQVGSGGVGSSATAAQTIVQRGTGRVTLIQAGTNLNGQLNYFIYLHPPSSAYAGYSCWRPLFQLQLNYTR